MSLYWLETVSYKASAHFRSSTPKMSVTIVITGPGGSEQVRRGKYTPTEELGVRKRVMSKTGVKGKGKADTRRKEQVHEVGVEEKLISDEVPLHLYASGNVPERRVKHSAIIKLEGKSRFSLRGCEETAFPLHSFSCAGEVSLSKRFKSKKRATC